MPHTNSKYMLFCICLGQSSYTLKKLPRFELLKEFLISDEMLLSCIFFIWSSPSGCSCCTARLRRGVTVEGSVESSLGKNNVLISLHVVSLYSVDKQIYLPLPHSGGILLIVNDDDTNSPVNLRKNRSKRDDVYVEMSLLDLEQKYGSTETGRLFVSIYYVWNSICKFPNPSTHDSMFCFGREFLADLQKSQKGRPHPDKQVGPCLSLFKLCTMFVVLLFLQLWTWLAAVQQEPEVPHLQNLWTHQIEEWAWLA